MSLEAALKENTETMRELIEVLTRTTLADAQGAAASAKKTSTPKANAKGAPAAESTEAPQPEAKAETPAPAAAVTKAVDADYGPVKQAILAATAAGHRKSVTDILAEFGAKTGQDLNPADYAKVLEKVKALTAETDLA